MKLTARAAANLGVETVVGFTGSAIWKYVAMFPPVSAELIEAGYQDFATRWNRILDVFDEVGVRFAHEVHPSEIAYDYWTTVATLDAIDHRPAFGLNWDPSHMVWQGVDPAGFIWDFKDRIYHVDCKDTRLRPDRRSLRRAVVASAVGRSPQVVGLRVDRTRRRALGGLLPHPQRDRLRGPDLGRVGGRRDGSARRRSGRARLRTQDDAVTADGGVRRGVLVLLNRSSVETHSART